MDDPLHPAVRDVAATGALGVAVGAAVLAVAAAAGSAPEALLGAAGALVVVAIATPLRLPRTVRDIFAEVREAPDARVDEGLSRAVWWSLPILAAGLGLTALLSLPAAAYGAVLLGLGASALGQAWWLRRWERLNGRRLLYRPAYRWAGTNGRVLGRGWFDPANFADSD
jgi:hypothetical protein